MAWYNKKRKVDFINQYPSIVGDHTFNTIFNKTAILENELGKDCSLFTLPEISDLARSFHSADPGSIKHKISLLRSYAQFCIDNGISETGINHYIEMTASMCADAVDKRKMAETYITRKEVEEIVSVFENPRDQYIILAPYEGIYGQGLCEILQLRESDLLGQNRVRLCTGREIEVSDLLYRIMVKAAEAETAIYNGRERRLKNTDHVYKGIVIKSNTGIVTEYQLKRKLNKLKNYLDRGTLGFRMLYVSGFLNEIDKQVQKYGGFWDAIEGINTVIEHYQAPYGAHIVKQMYKEMLSIKQD